MPKKSLWGPAVSTLFVIITTITPINEGYRPGLLWASWLIFVLVCLGWFLEHTEPGRTIRTAGGNNPMVLIIVGVIGACLSIGMWLFVNPKPKQPSPPISQDQQPHAEPSPTHPPVPSQNQKAPGHHNNQQQQNNSGGINTQQSTSGNNSPIVSGSHNQITIYSAPKDPGGFSEAQGLPETVTFTLGDHGFTAAFPTESLRNSNGAEGVVHAGGFRPVRLHIKNGVIVCDVKIWAGTGQSPVEVKDNEFTVRRHGWDRNFSDNAFEVVNEQGLPVFQLIRKTKADFVFKGFMAVPGGLLVANENLLVNPTGDPLRGVPIPRIFKYPSWKYPGKYTDD